MLEHGVAVSRLGLPDHDLRQFAVVSAVQEEIEARSAAGKRSVLWVSLPRTPWCTWQHVNVKRSCFTGDFSFKSLCFCIQPLADS